MGGPLEGILVVALEQAVAAPFCSSRLADAGARVIKIERDEGDFARGYDHVAHGESAYFVWVNRGKESLCLNIKDEGDRELFLGIIARADVFIQNLAPGATARLGLASDYLRSTNERLITLDISGYGESGPYRHMKAYDLLVQCESGLASITGSPESPGRVGVSICDIACGMYAHAAILQALFERQSTGKGQGLSVSLFDSIADWLAVPLMHQEYTGKAPGRVGLNHPSISPYGAYRCGEGADVVISIQNNREWQNFCATVLERADMVDAPKFAQNTDRCSNRKELDGLIHECFLSLSREELVQRLNDANIAYASLNGVAELLQHAQLRKITVASPTGPVDCVAPPVIAFGKTFSPGAVPAVGEHSESIRDEFS
ncbi:MAG: CoA transferase [Gammaproteobacteria bacterium]|nr:MAG: CoA transferase [Gammaproteobacteria bacterium]